MAERLAALGLKPPTKPGESVQQRQERDAKERRERVLQAEAEDAKREDERQRRIADEKPSAPLINRTSKKPPLPPARKRGDSGAQRAEIKRKEDDALRAEAEQQGKEQAIKDQQRIQQSETRGIE